ncbi:MAG: NAD-dependent succinate-semialdehyde dehydrogenase [Bdellovibrionales bacterium]
MNLIEKAFVGGEWIETAEESIKVLNPATEEIIGSVPNLGASEAQIAISAAKDALSLWKSLDAFDRSKFLRKIYELIIERVDDYAKVLTLENGKSLSEARGEIIYGAGYFELYSEECKRINGEILTSPKASKIELTREPIGVVGLITPWNFPQAMLARKLSAALAAGCTVVAKPDHQTPFSALLLGKICEDAGLPKGVVNILTGQPEPIAKQMMDSSVVKKVSFTGSTRVGKILISQSAATVKKLSLELGGNAAFIVFDDADLDKAVEGAMASKYRNSGQTCVCTNRFFVHRSIAKEFVSRFKEKVFQLKIGNGLVENVKVGPMINKLATDKMEQLIEEIRKVPNTIIHTTDINEDRGFFYPPTLVVSESKNHRLFKEEIFGPISAIYEFDSEEDVIELANETEYGLASYFYTKDASRIERVTKALDYGMIGVNSGRVSHPYAPFGGVKESGFGREGGKLGILEYTNVKMRYQLV